MSSGSMHAECWLLRAYHRLYPTNFGGFQVTFPLDRRQGHIRQIYMCNNQPTHTTATAQTMRAIQNTVTWQTCQLIGYWHINICNLMHRDNMSTTTTTTTTATTTKQQQLFNSPLSRTIQVSWYQKRHSSTHVGVPTCHLTEIGTSLAGRQPSTY